METIIPGDWRRVRETSPRDDGRGVDPLHQVDGGGVDPLHQDDWRGVDPLHQDDGGGVDPPRQVYGEGVDSLHRYDGGVIHRFPLSSSINNISTFCVYNVHMYTVPGVHAVFCGYKTFTASVKTLEYCLQWLQCHGPSSSSQLVGSRCKTSILNSQ